MNKVLYTFTLATMGAEAAQTVYDLRWMLVFIVWLLATDMWFSFSCCEKSHRTFSLSQEGRTACNKFVDYIAYLLSGAILGLAIFEPLGITDHISAAAAGLALGCVWEMESIVDHVCELHGMKSRHSIRRLLAKILKSKFKWMDDE